MNDERSGSGRLVAALAWHRRVRVLAAVVDAPARELCARHELDAGASRVAAEGLVAALLFTCQGKGEERFTVHAESEQPAFALTVDVGADGGFRGRFQPASLPAPDGGAEARFRGVLAVLKYVADEEHYRGVAPVEDETFERALARFLTASVQVDGRVRIQVELDAEGRVAAARGLMLERMPDLEPEAFAEVFDGALQEDLGGLMTQFAFGELAGQPVEVFEAREVRFSCPCSRERVRSMLSATGAADLRAMIEEDGGAEVTCEFCRERYRFDPDELRALLAALE